MVTTTKTWQFNLNGFIPANATKDSFAAHYDRRQLMLEIKNALKGFGSSPWTVTESSDAVTAAGGTDKWIDPDDLKWRDDDLSGVFSWIVLRQTGISTTFELLIACEEDNINNDGSEIGAWVSQVGFTGGTTTARPTASDERLLRDSTFSGWWGSGQDAVSYNFRFHVMQSTDGECTRVLIFINGVNTGLWIFDKPNNPITEWTTPYVAVILGTNDAATEQCSYALLYDSASMKSLFGGNTTTMYMSGEGFASAAVGEFMTSPNQLNGSYIAGGIGLSSLTSTFVGRMGEVYDLWWGFTVGETGRYFPEDNTKAYVQVNHLIFPWDGSSLLGTI